MDVRPAPPPPSPPPPPRPTDAARERWAQAAAVAAVAGAAQARVASHLRDVAEVRAARTANAIERARHRDDAVHYGRLVERLRAERARRAPGGRED